MATTKNPSVDQGVAVPQSAGQVVLQRFEYTFGAAYASADINNADKIQIGVVPAGCKLVPHLSRISMIAIDTNGSPTGDYTIGSTDDPDALKGSAASETAVVLSGEDFTVTTSDLGALAADVKVYVTAVADSATTPTSGQIVAELAFRSFDSNTDVDVT